MDSVPAEHRAAVDAIDHVAALRRAGVRNTSGTAVLWRSPHAAEFVRYSVAQWRAVAPFLVHADAQAAVERQIAAAQRQRRHVFCWALPPPVAGLPPVGALFFATVLAWNDEFTPCAT